MSLFHDLINTVLMIFRLLVIIALPLVIGFYAIYKGLQGFSKRGVETRSGGKLTGKRGALIGTVGVVVGIAVLLAFVYLVWEVLSNENWVH